MVGARFQVRLCALFGGRWLRGLFRGKTHDFSHRRAAFQWRRLGAAVAGFDFFFRPSGGFGGGAVSAASLAAEARTSSKSAATC